MFVHNAICSSVSNVCLTTRLNVFMGNLERWFKKMQYFLCTWCKEEGSVAGKDGAADNRSCGEGVMRGVHISWGFHHTFWEHNTHTHGYGSKREITPAPLLCFSHSSCKLFRLWTCTRKKKWECSTFGVFSECAKLFKYVLMREEKVRGMVLKQSCRAVDLRLM